MRRILILSVLGFTACTPEFESLEEACHDKVPGEGTADCCNDAIRAVKRMNCYRRYAGMSRGRLDGKVAKAASAHAEYLDYNGISADDPIWFEDNTLQKFTGADPYERADAQGLEILEGSDMGVWEGAWLNTTGLSPEEVVDDWVDFYWWRQVVLQPAWSTAGYGQFNDIVVGTVYYEFPAASNVGTPVHYPVAGQTGVPTTFIMPVAGYPVEPGTEIGYPITVTVGSSDPTSDINADNPYGLVLLDEFVEGPEGVIDYFVEGPETTGADFPYTIAIVPVDPLVPNTTYRVGVEVSWDDGERQKKFTWQFTTGQEAADGTGRRVDGEQECSQLEQLYVYHRPPSWMRGRWAE